MATFTNTEMLDELAVECMDLQVAIGEEPNKAKHKELITRTINKIITSNKFQPIPDFEDGKHFINITQHDLPISFFKILIGSTCRSL